MTTPPLETGSSRGAERDEREASTKTPAEPPAELAPKATIPRPKSQWTVQTTPHDHSLLPTLGVTLWLGWNGFLIYLLVYLICFASTVVRAVVIGVLGLSLVLPRDVAFGRGDEFGGCKMGMGRRFGNWCMLMAERYFGLTTILEDEPALDRIANDPSQKAAVFAFEPHDILPYAVFAFSPALRRLPGRVGDDHSCLMTGAIFRIPILRQVYTWVSGNPVDKRTFKGRLERGESFTFVPGGVQEVTSLDPANPDDLVLYLKSRKGFVKLALASGSPVVPVFCFGVDGSYGYWIPRGRHVAEIGRQIGFLPLVFWGRFGLPFGIPHPRKIKVAVGSPIEFPCMGEGRVTDEAVAKYHTLFLEEMEALYERHKIDAGYGNRRLRMI